MLATQLRVPRVAAAAGQRRAAVRPSRLPASAVRVVAFIKGDEQQEKEAATSSAKVTFQIPMHVEFGQEVAVVGGAESLGSWDAKSAVRMAWNDGDVWTAEAEVPAGTPVEYKYIIVGGEEVLEWQPCNNLEVQAEEAELTIRDAWQGEQHEVLPGTLPPPAPAVEQQEEEAPPAPVEAELAHEPEPAAPAVDVAPVLAAVAEVEAAPAPAPAVVDEPPAVPKAAAVPAPAPAAAPPAPVAAKASEQRRSRRSTTSKAANSGAAAKPANGSAPSPANGNGKVVAAAAAPAVDGAAQKGPRYGGLSTVELRDACKQQGLPAKGQRKDLLSRLQQLLNQRRPEA